MKELSPDAQSVIESAAGLDDPRPADRERVRRAVMAVVGAGAGLGGATAAGSAAAASAATSAAAGTGSAIGAGIGAGGVLKLIGWVVVGAGVGFSLPLPSAESATQAPDPLPAATAVVAASDPPPRAADPIAERELPPPTTTTKPPPARTPRAIAAPPSSDSLAAESRLIAEAQRELAAGRPELALARIDEHAERHPSGVLSPERDAARVLALCASGQSERARELSQRFLAQHPTSPLAPRVRSACKP